MPVPPRSRRIALQRTTGIMQSTENQAAEAGARAPVRGSRDLKFNEAPRTSKPLNVNEYIDLFPRNGGKEDWHGRCNLPD
jgi:hypothetical protein